MKFNLLSYIPPDLTFGQRFQKGPILTSIEQLNQKDVKPETAIRLASARPLFTNYTLLQHDFPQLREDALDKRFPMLQSLSGIKRQQAIYQKLDEWLIRNIAFVSQRQAHQSDVNDPIKLGNETLTAYRPPAYGRALVFSLEENEKALSNWGNEAVFENRLIDVKGTGVAPGVLPTDKDHSNGIYKLGFGLVELCMHELLSRVLQHANSQVYTLPVYGIIDLGFNYHSSRSKDGPAAMIARRASRRAESPGGLYSYGSEGQQLQVAVEKLIRQYGITSVNEVTTVKVWREAGQLKIQYGEQDINFFSEEQLKEIERVSHIGEGEGPIYFEGINIEHTREFKLDPLEATLIDFESFSTKAVFEHPLLSLVNDKLLRWGGSILPHYDDFVQPDPALQVPFHLINEKGGLWGYDMHKDWGKIYSLCYGLGHDFSENKISRNMLLRTLKIYVDELTQHLEI